MDETILPVLVAVPVVRLVMVALLPARDAPLTRIAVVAVPALVAVAAAARARPREWPPRRHSAGDMPDQSRQGVGAQSPVARGALSQRDTP